MKLISRDYLPIGTPLQGVHSPMGLQQTALPLRQALGSQPCLSCFPCYRCTTSAKRLPSWLFSASACNSLFYLLKEKSKDDVGPHQGSGSPTECLLLLPKDACEQVMWHLVGARALMGVDYLSGGSAPMHPICWELSSSTMSCVKETTSPTGSV